MKYVSINIILEIMRRSNGFHGYIFRLLFQTNRCPNPDLTSTSHVLRLDTFPESTEEDRAIGHPLVSNNITKNVSMTFRKYKFLLLTQSKCFRTAFRPTSSATRRFVRGDQDMCYSGSCEFFLMCWLSGGLVEEGCGGFLFACCTRPGRAHYSSPFSPNNFRESSRGLVPFEHGPVRNDPCEFSNSQISDKNILM